MLQRRRSIRLPAKSRNSVNRQVKCKVLKSKEFEKILLF
jgi:hypothetical protein